MGKNCVTQKIKHKKVEYSRQSNLENCWIDLNRVQVGLSTFLIKSKYKKNNFDWKVFIDNLHGQIKQIILTNQVTLTSKPYTIITQHFNILNRLSESDEIIKELTKLLYILTKYCKCV